MLLEEENQVEKGIGQHFTVNVTPGLVSDAGLWAVIHSCPLRGADHTKNFKDSQGKRSHNNHELQKGMGEAYCCFKSGLPHLGRRLVTR